MNDIYDSLLAYCLDRNGYFTNPYGVEFSITDPSDCQAVASLTLPVKCEDVQCIYQYTGGLSLWIQHFSLRQAEDLDWIDEPKLLNLYKRNIVSITCHLANQSFTFIGNQVTRSCSKPSFWSRYHIVPQPGSIAEIVKHCKNIVASSPLKHKDGMWRGTKHTIFKSAR